MNEIEKPAPPVGRVVLWAGVALAASVAAMHGGALKVWTIMAGTLVSEDLTCIASGYLVWRRELPWLTAVFACTAGIYLGDLGLFCLGRMLGGNAALARFLPARKVGAMRQWMDRQGPWVFVAARFLPGTRLPLYVAAGTVGAGAWQFAGWTLLAAVLWAPAVVLLVAAYGETFVRPFEAYLGAGWMAVGAAGIVCWAALKLASRGGAALWTTAGRARIWAAVSKLWRWEFWPAWVFYPPVGAWVAGLSVRYRGFTVVTAANPAISLGGFIGESKEQILNSLPREWVIPYGLVPAGPIAERIARLRKVIHTTGLAFPLILKPDVGQRGVGLKLAGTFEEAEEYLAGHEPAVLVQKYHPGPFEAGILYYRIPGEGAGRIFSVTDKVFPAVVGDGVATLEELIWNHPRFRMQGGTFLARHRGEGGRVLGRGEAFRLAVAGNHCQGTLFRDGSHLITPVLQAKVDEIASAFDGFFFGRFDVRYSDVDGFRRGEDLAIVELNGVTSESTNIYDPSFSLRRAYATLFRQWAILFRIGELNRQRGHRPADHVELLRAIIGHYRERRAKLIGD